MTARLLVVACGLQASATLAHPGHGTAPAASWLHGLELAHVVPAVAALALAVLAGAALRRRAALRGRQR